MLDSLLDQLARQRGIGDQADYVLLMPGAPFYVDAPGLVTDDCFPVNRFSISGAYTTAFITADVLDGTSATRANRYARTGYDPYRPDRTIVNPESR